MNLFIFFTAFFSVFLTSLAQISLRKTMLTVGELPTSLREFIPFCISICFNIWFIFGMMLYIISLGLWLIVLKKIDVSVAYPLSAMGFVITALIAYFFLNETLSILRIIGLLLIITGIVIISRN